MTVTAFAFVRLIVADVDMLETFYCDVLGFTRAMQVEEGQGDDALREIFLSIGAHPTPQVALLQYLNRPAPKPGEAILALSVDNVDTMVSAIENAGGRITLPAFDIPEHRLRMAYATDPEGHTIELLQTAAER